MPMKVHLSPSAKAICELIQRISAGNQTDFARAVGCAQPVISRIVNGRQEPGRELLERIGELKGVDKAALLGTLEPAPGNRTHQECLVPLANCLLDGPPASRLDQLTANAIPVSPLLYRPSLYAVPARFCQPAFSDPLERMRADDRIVIDASLEKLKTNLLGVNGRLCVIQIKATEGNTLTLRRVWVTSNPKSDSKSERWAIYRRSDTKPIKDQEVMFDGRMLRSIQLDLPESQPEPEFITQPVKVVDIVGIAVELFRAL